MSGFGMSELCVHLGTGGQLHKILAADGQELSRGFYGNGQNTQRRPAEARADYMDAILHNMHLHANQMYDIIL